VYSVGFVQLLGDGNAEIAVERNGQRECRRRAFDLYRSTFFAGSFGHRVPDMARASEFTNQQGRIAL